jgi:glycosyltransferase involved in cell wall biosynthesis
MTARPEPSVRNGNRAVRVTLISTLPPQKGVADYTTHLVGALATTPAVELEVIDFADLYPPRLYPGGELRDQTAKRPAFPNVRVRTMLRWYNPLSWLWAGLTLKGEVVHAQWWSYVLAPQYVSVLALARLRRRRIVITVHNVEPHETGRWQRLLNRLVLRFAAAYIVHDARSRDRLAEIVPAGKPIAVIPMGPLASDGPDMSQSQARAALGLPGQAKVVLAFGNIRPYKGIDVLLRAFAVLRDRVPDARLIIAGKAWEDWSRYQTLIDGLGLAAAVDTRLAFVPASEVSVFFSAADVVALPYLQFDAQSAVGSRALHHGKPLIVSDTGGLPELVVDERAVVPPGDSAALAEALAAVLSDAALRAKLEADSRARATALSWDTIAADTVRLYAELAGAASRSVISLADERSRRQERVQR